MVIIGTNRRRKRPLEWLPIHTSAPWHQNSFESIPCVKCGVTNENNEMCLKKNWRCFCGAFCWILWSRLNQPFNFYIVVTVGYFGPKGHDAFHPSQQPEFVVATIQVVQKPTYEIFTLGLFPGTYTVHGLFLVFSPRSGNGCVEFSSARFFHSWPKLGGVIRDHFFGVFSSWLPGMGGSKGQPWKLVSCCGFAQKDFLGKFFLAQMFWKKMDSQVDVCETAFSCFKKWGGGRKKH